MSWVRYPTSRAVSDDLMGIEAELARLRSYLPPTGMHGVTHETGGTDVVRAPKVGSRMVAAVDASATAKTTADYVCDGIADDVEIKQAIAALPSTGGIVILSEGHFNISTTLNLGVGDITLQGSGMESTVLNQQAAVDMVLIGNGATYMLGGAVRDLRLNGVKATFAAGNAIRLYGTIFSRIEHVHIYNFKERGIWLDSTGTRGTSWSLIHDGCYITDCDSGGVGANGDGGSAWIVMNHLAGNGAGTIAEISLTSATEFYIGLNRFSDVTHQAIRLYSCSEGDVIHNFLTDVDHDGISLGGTCSHIRILDNRLLNIGEAASNTYTGIDLSDSTYCKVTDNDISPKAGTLKYGIVEGSGADYNSICNNTLGGIATQAIVKVGAHTRAWGNIGANQGSEAISARVYNSANQAITTSTETSLTFDSEVFDTDGIHSVASNTDRLTAPVTGKYLVGINIRWDGNATGQRNLVIRYNDSSYIAANTLVASGATDIEQCLATVIDLTVGDYVTAKVWQDSGGNLNVEYLAGRSPYFWIVHLGA